MTVHRTLALLGLAAASMAAPAQAASFLNQYNLVTLGDARGQSHVDYNAFIGGNLTTQGGGGNMDFSLHSYSIPGDVGLTVVGNVVAQNAGTFKVLNNKNALVGGTISPSNALQAASITVGTPQNGLAAQLAAQKTSIAAEMSALSAAYNNLATNSSLRFPQPGEPIQNVSSFVATPVGGLAIFDISITDLITPGIGTIKIDPAAATSIVINVHGTGAGGVFNFNGVNLDGSSWNTDFIKSKTLWNFVDATEINLGSNWYGALLAPKATVTNSSNIDGSVFVNSINLRGEIHKPFYTGYVPDLTPTAVPEPASLAMAGLGFGALALAARRLRR